MIIQWLTNFALVQLFLTLISLPILIAWGLPISCISPIGNMIYNPLLCVYLLCTVLLFFSELVGIPNSIVVYALELITSIWLWCMNLLTRSVHIGFAKPHLLILCIIPLVACSIVWYFSSRRPYICIVALSCVLLCVSVMLCRSDAAPQLFHVSHGTRAVRCIVDKGTVLVIDQEGVLASSSSADQWMIYHLIPAITQKSGYTHIDHYILCHPRQRSFEAITALCKQMPIKTVYLPRWTGQIKRSAWKMYKTMYTVIQDCGGSVVSYNSPFSITLSDTGMVYCIPSGDIGHYHQATYPIYTPDVQGVSELSDIS